MKGRNTILAVLGVLIVCCFLGGGYLLLAKKTLVCEYNLEDMGAKRKVIYTSTFRNDELSNLKMDITLELDDHYVKYNSTFLSNLKTQYEFVTKKKSVSSDLVNNKDVISYTIIADARKLSNKELEDLDISGRNLYLVKKSLEKNFFTCK